MQERRSIIEPSKYQNHVNFAMTPAAYRARRPYFWKNTALGGALFGVVVGVYMYTSVVFRPDDFSDVPIPPMSPDQLAALREEQERLIDKNRVKK